MHRYVSYLRQPRSQPLSIREFNARHGELLDENRDFEHACLLAWQAGAPQRKRNVALTNAFPKPPPLRRLSNKIHNVPLVSNTLHVATHRGGVTTRRLSNSDVAALRQFASRAGGSVPASMQHWLPECSARAVSAALRQLDAKVQTPTLRLPHIS